MKNLTGKTALLTGASQGIGPFIARALAAAGTNLVLVARTMELLKEVAQEIRGVEVEVVKADITNSDQRQNLPKRARAAFGQIDILVNNAGIEEIVRFERQDTDTIRRIIETNLLAPMLLTRDILPHMLNRGSGHIVNIASLAGRTSMPYGAVYAASKGGLAEWSLSLYSELGDTPVSVSTICPGFVRESGLFARRGRDAPAGLGTSRPQAVARAVVRAIQQDLPEVIVNRRPIRPLMALRALAPRAALSIGRRLGLVGFLRSLADGS